MNTESPAPSASNKTDTLYGGRKVPVVYGDGRTDEVQVRQLRLCEYEKAFGLLMDEMALTAFICGKAKQWLYGNPPEYHDAVRPESYEMIQAAAWEVNAAGFFSFVDRTVNQRMTQLATLPADKLRVAIAAGAQVSGATSPTLWPGPQPRPS